MAKNIKTKKGFTIIEVVLVLAIAGLIFLMVFVALPQLQRSQRDTQRRQDLSRVVTSLVQYQTNNRTKRNNLPPMGAAYFPEGDDGEVKFSSCVSSFSGTQGTTMSSACSFIKNYMNATNATSNTFADPDGFPYNMLITENYALNRDGLTTTAISGLEEKSKLDPIQVTATVDGKENTTVNGYTLGGDDVFGSYVIYVVPGGQCSGESVIPSELRHFAILYQLEGSGVYCVGSDNN